MISNTEDIIFAPLLVILALLSPEMFSPGALVVVLEGDGAVEVAGHDGGTYT